MQTALFVQNSNKRKHEFLKLSVQLYNFHTSNARITNYNMILIINVTMKQCESNSSGYIQMLKQACIN